MSFLALCYKKTESKNPHKFSFPRTLRQDMVDLRQDLIEIDQTHNSLLVILSDLTSVPRWQRNHSRGGLS